jgi:hypothetical protein
MQDAVRGPECGVGNHGTRNSSRARLFAGLCRSNRLGFQRAVKPLMSGMPSRRLFRAMQVGAVRAVFPVPGYLQACCQRPGPSSRSVAEPWSLQRVPPGCRSARDANLAFILFMIVALIWLVPLVACLMLAMVSWISPRFKRLCAHHLFGPDEPDGAQSGPMDGKGSSSGTT